MSNKTEIITFRCSKERKESIKRNAEKCNKTISDYLYMTTETKQSIRSTKDMKCICRIKSLCNLYKDNQITNDTFIEQVLNEVDENGTY